MLPLQRTKAVFRSMSVSTHGPTTSCTATPASAALHSLCSQAPIRPPIERARTPSHGFANNVRALLAARSESTRILESPCRLCSGGSGPHALTREYRSQGECVWPSWGRVTKQPVWRYRRVVGQGKRGLTGKIPQYDFNRFNTLYNGGDPILFPLDRMKVAPFLRPDPEDTDEEVFEAQSRQDKVPMSEIKTLLPEPLHSHISGRGSFLKTKHADNMFIGFAPNEQGGEDRYLLKFFSSEHSQVRNARREALFSYLYVEAGERAHVPHVMYQKIHGHNCIVRRFYRAQDGRMLLNHSIFETPVLPQGLKEATAVRNYALRYVLFNDLDFENAGNVLFVSHSKLTDKVIMNIDGEDIMPDEESMKGFADTDWVSGDAIPGGCRWRDERTAELGPERFFELQAKSENPMFAFLSLWHGQDVDKIKASVFQPEDVARILASRPHLEQLTRSFGAESLSLLNAGEANFQRVFDRWATHVHKHPDKPITMWHLATGQYLC